MRKIVIHWERLTFGTLINLAAAQQATEYEQILLFCRAIDPLIDGTSLIDRPISEAQAIMAQFAAEGVSRIPEALAQFSAAAPQRPVQPAALPPHLPPAPLKDTGAYTAQPGEKAEN